VKWLNYIRFRCFDRELNRPVDLPDRDSMETGEWNQLIGSTGERLAGKYLTRHGMKVLYRNFRAKGGGEVDIIARDGETLVFSEVKARTSEQFGRPADAVDRKKQRLIVKGANAWLRELNHPEVVFRFDIVEVLLEDGNPPDIRVNEAAFSSPQVGLGM
tara:strand:+ start:106 stop:582 length:477 start_codon:yes stop_codon:yes gene_type:complete